MPRKKKEDSPYSDMFIKLAQYILGKKGVRESLPDLNPSRAHQCCLRSRKTTLPPTASRQLR